MPNWCYSTLRVSGPEQGLKIFREYALKGCDELYTDAFIPYPEKFRRLDEIAKEWEMNVTKDSDWNTRPKDGFNSGGYAWCLENWGTKWGICSAALVGQDDKFLMYQFETAWSPCIPIIRAMSDKFPTLRFDYEYEDEMGEFQGSFGIQHGRCFKNDCHDYLEPEEREEYGD